MKRETEGEPGGQERWEGGRKKKREKHKAKAGELGERVSITALGKVI